MALTDNLLAYYKLDGNSNDSVGSNNGTDTSISYVSGKINQSALFNGTNSSVTLTISQIPTNTITYNYWIKSSSTTYQNIIRGEKLGMLSTIYLNKVRNYLYNGTWNTSDSNTSVNDGNWHMVTVTYNGSSIKTYIDGVLDKTDTISITLTSPSTDFWFGREISAGQAVLNGYLDEVGLWSRALSSTEVTQLYNSGAGLAYPFSAASQNSNFFLSM